MVVVLPFFGDFPQMTDDKVTELFRWMDVFVVVEVEAALHSGDGGHFFLHLYFSLGDIWFVTEAEVATHSELKEF